MDLNSFKWGKVATKHGNARHVGIGHPICSTLCENCRSAILHHILCTCFTKKPIFGVKKGQIHFLIAKDGSYFWQYCFSRKYAHMCQVWAIHHQIWLRKREKRKKRLCRVPAHGKALTAGPPSAVWFR